MMSWAGNRHVSEKSLFFKNKNILCQHWQKLPAGRHRSVHKENQLQSINIKSRVMNGDSDKAKDQKTGMSCCRQWPVAIMLIVLCQPAVGGVC